MTLTPQEREAVELARQFHEAYERLAPNFGYATRKDSAVFWDEVPERNKNLMIATAAEVLAKRADAPASEDGALEASLQRILEYAPSLPKEYAWSGQSEALFDNGIRHKPGKKPIDYLKSWLSMLRPFAYATRDDSWGEMEKLLCIVMRNYVRVAAAADEARAHD